ncbi:hypothetical protein T484DRAFT_1787637 [Baffinella frigidus]|nr:hypothetical protein T484DRAFT_1787637 [Cryptophyta sp. CCMP2293]
MPSLDGLMLCIGELERSGQVVIAIAVLNGCLKRGGAGGSSLYFRLRSDIPPFVCSDPDVSDGSVKLAALFALYTDNTIEQKAALVQALQALPAVGGGARVGKMRAQVQILLAEFHAAEGKVQLASKLLADALAHKPPPEAETRVRVAQFTLQTMCGDTHRALQDLRAAAGERGIGAPDAGSTGAALAGRTLCMLLCAQVRPMLTL